MDRYVLGRELGRGGMAIVYLAHDLKHDRSVALKVLHADLAASLGPDRFLREIRITARLDHPHILPVLDSGEVAGQLWYTMPYVDGESLRHRLRREGQLPIDEAIRLAREAADALDYAHRHGVVHRDIKPENILLSDGHARVADFGVARALEAAGGGQLTQTGMAVGTPVYMSPEQATAGHVDARTDQYSLACVLYELLTGEAPYTGATPQAVIAKRMLEPVPRVRTLRDSVPAAIEVVLMRALAKIPADRFPSTGEFARALESAGRTEQDSVVALPNQQDHARRGPILRRPAIQAAAALFVIALLIAGAFLLRDRTGSAREPPRDMGSTNVLAVLPFTVRGSPAIEYLGEGLVALLSASLDGAAGIRSVNAHALLGFVGGGRSAISLERARGVAEHFQAGLFVVGDVLEVQGKLRLSASLFDRTQGDRPLAEATVDGEPGDVLSLVDLLATRLAADRSAEAGARLARAAAVTTSSLPALKAYLAGEQAYRAGQYAAAVGAFQEAVAADTAFALAYYRLSMAQERLVSVDESRRSAELAFRHSSRLSVHDRRFLEAVLAMRRGRSGRRRAAAPRDRPGLSGRRGGVVSAGRADVSREPTPWRLDDCGPGAVLAGALLRPRRSRSPLSLGPHRGARREPKRARLARGPLLSAESCR